MTSETSDKPRRLRPPETGWARAQRLRGKDALRTCLPAVDRGGTFGTPRPGTEDHIVRGED